MIIDPHPLLDLRAFTTTFPRPLGETPTPPDILALLSSQAEAPLQRNESVREAVRALLRHGGFKPAGRSKPASEYLLRAVEDGALTSINAAVDVCNIVSLHSGLPVTVVDLSKAKPPFRIAVALAGSNRAAAAPPRGAACNPSFLRSLAQSNPVNRQSHPPRPPERYRPVRSPALGRAP